MSCTASARQSFTQRDRLAGRLRRRAEMMLIRMVEGINPNPGKRCEGRENLIGGSGRALDLAEFLFLQATSELFRGYLPQHGHRVVGSISVWQAEEVGCRHCWFAVPARRPASRLSRLVVRSNRDLVATGTIPFLAIRGGAQAQQLAG